MVSSSYLWLENTSVLPYRHLEHPKVPFILFWVGHKIILDPAPHSLTKRGSRYCSEYSYNGILRCLKGFGSLRGAMLRNFFSVATNFAWSFLELQTFSETEKLKQLVVVSLSTKFLLLTGAIFPFLPCQQL